MDIPSSLYYCSCLLLLLAARLLYSLAKCYYSNPSSRSGHRGGLRLPPRPWQLPVVGSLHHLLGDLPHRSLRRLSRRYGCPHLMLLRFGELPVVVVSSGEAAREVMRTHDAAFATRPQTATVRTLTKQGQAIALTPHGDHWRWLRKLCAVELLSAARVRSFRPVREEEAARLVGAVAASGGGSGNNKLVNLSEMMAAYVADTAVHAIMGDASTTDLFSAGTETAATTLQWAMAELMRNPDVMSRAQAEVRGAFMSRSKVLEKGLSNLTYLHWVIKETLRLHTPGPLLIPRECRETCKVLGYDVPKGAMVLVNAWAISRDPQS
ncbi:hypothetical protein HU200_032914 [Digitaria exilis]|uniref:Cytochrome P450 n=1 Tax=Digitaria exilis TaxID=1010633 RepID=A0A835BNH1_9POAL|nr:hypothetical protein HU200_032914 [Digitaria exilis]